MNPIENTHNQLIFDFTHDHSKENSVEFVDIENTNVVSLCLWRSVSAKKRATEEKEIVTRIIQHSKLLGW